jgi:regulator of protease activity HflC (stomatin/prohibitin superfamily)
LELYNGLALLVLGVFAIIGVLVFAGRFLREIRKARVVVDETQVGLRIRKGVVSENLKAGEYSTWLSTDRIELVDMREQSLQVAGQEVLTRDLLPVKITLLARYKVYDPKALRSVHAHPTTKMYEDLQLELRRRIAAATLDEVMADRDRVMAGFREAIAGGLRPIGLEITAVELRDISLAGPAKQAFADIWKAQKEGQAALERARGEQASLRSLANAARMLKGNPELMNLRLLQALSGGPGKSAPTVVLGGGAGLLPVSSGPAEPAPDDGG